MEWNEYEIGQRVTVSDGAKRPPDRFNRKLRAWENNNFTGRVMETQAPRDYNPYGSITVSNDEFQDSAVITFQFNFPLGSVWSFIPIVEAA